jgi:hypothetical protein
MREAKATQAQATGGAARPTSRHFAAACAALIFKNARRGIPLGSVTFSLGTGRQAGTGHLCTFLGPDRSGGGQQANQQGNKSPKRFLGVFSLLPSERLLLVRVQKKQAPGLEERSTGQPQLGASSSSVPPSSVLIWDRMRTASHVVVLRRRRLVVHTPGSDMVHTQQV